MTLSTAQFGKMKDGTVVTAYRLENGAGGSVTLLDYGAIVQSLRIPGRNGVVDVALGYDTIEEYQRDDGHLGAAIGRVGNRIGGASFSLGGKTYQLAKNDGENHLHGGVKGFDRRMWKGEPGDGFVAFTRLSPDGEEGYPGNLNVRVSYTLTEDHALVITYDADTDQDTLVNMTNHTYFNLNGGGTVLNHVMQIFSPRFAENDDGCLPTGQMLDVEGTPFDFRTPKTLGRDIGSGHIQLQRCGGYDHNYAVCGRAAVLRGDESGIEMTVDTDMPGMQLYSGNFLTSRKGKGGADYGPRDAVCLETQLYPNAMACYGFPSPVLRAGRHLHSETRYAFRTV